MIYNKYGSTDIEVSAIGFGGMRFGEEKNDDKCVELLKTAYEKGINYFDTAPAYEKSERLYGVAFQEMKKTRREKPFYVSTKTLKLDPASIRQELETSLKTMGLDHIDFYHVWCVRTLEDFLDRKQKGVIAEFEKLRDEGLIKHICMSAHATGPELQQIIDDYQFNGILLGYSIMNFKYRDEGIDAAAKLNRAIVVMNPLGGGGIPKNPDKFQFVKTRSDETVVEAALRFLINDPRITVALVGLSSLKQLNEALSAVDGFEPIPAEKIQQIRGQLDESFNQLCTCCRYCDLCPQQIPVPLLMDIYNHVILQGKNDIVIDLLKYYGGFDIGDNFLGNCTECGLCEKACTQKLNIRERLQFLRNKVEQYLNEHPEERKK